MKLIEILKSQGLTDDQINKIINAMKENKIYETSLENAEEEYSKLKTEKENLEGQLNTANDTIGKFEGGLTKKEADDLKVQHAEQVKQQIIDFKKDKAISNIFSHVEDEDVREFLISKIDREKIIIKEDGTDEGLQEQYEAISEKNPNLLKETIPNNTGSLGNYGRKGKPIVNPWSKETFNLTEQARILRENPTLAEQLKNNK